MVQEIKRFNYITQRDATFLVPENARVRLTEGDDRGDFQEIILKERHRKKENFTLSHRDFDEVDGYFRGMISQRIREAMSREIPVRVLDIGGGMGSRAVQEIEQKFGDKVSAISVDLVHDLEEGRKAKRVMADVKSLPIASNSIDIAYSMQLFPYLDPTTLRSFLTRDYPDFFQAVSEVARVLKPGGIAFIDDEMRVSRSEKKLRNMTEMPGVVYESGDSGNPYIYRDFPRVWRWNIVPEQYLVIKKTNSVL